MTGRLYPALPIHADETLTSYVSRLASFHRAPEARQFCKDFRMSFQSVCFGDADSIARLADLTGEPTETLRRAAHVGKDNMWWVRGEPFSWTTLRRSSIAYCPSCLQNDLANAAFPEAGPYERTAWVIQAFRTCPMHRVALSFIDGPHGIAQFRDFRRCLDPIQDDLPRIEAGAPIRSASGLEVYIQRRLDYPEAGEPFLDRIPLDAVIRTCEAFGTAALFGPQSASHLSTPDERAAAGDTGFNALRCGRSGIFDHLDALRDAHPDLTRTAGRPSKVYGRLFRWLTDNKAPAYSEIRDIVADHILGHADTNLRGVLFGRKIKDRPWYSIRSAYNTFGIDPMRIRHLLMATGMITDACRDLPDTRITVPADQIKALVDEVRDSVGWNGLTQRLGVKRLTASQFVGPELIKPLLMKGDLTLKSNLFRKSDIQIFLDRVFEGSIAIDRPTHDMCSITSAARRLSCRIKDVVDLILTRRLRWIGRRSDRTGLSALLFNIQEIQIRAAQNYGRGLKFTLCSRAMRISPKFLTALIQSGYLRAQVVGVNSQGANIKLVSNDSVKFFQEKYITQRELQRELRVKQIRPSVFLRRSGVSPINLEVDQTYAFYKRVEINNALANWNA